MKKVLIIQNKRIGDVLISSILANNFKKQFPDSEIHFMAYDFTAGVLLNNPNIDRIIPIQEKELKKLPNLLKKIKEVRKEKYDIILDPYSKFQSRVISKFSGAKISVGNKSRKRLGNLGYYTHPVSLLKNKSHIAGKAIEDRIQLLKQIDGFTTFDYEPKIFLSDEEKKLQLLPNKNNKKTIVLGVLGSTPQKSMPYKYVAAIADFISEEFDVNILFNYAPNQKSEALKIYEMCKLKENIIIDFNAPTIRDFIKVMSEATLLVSNEGGSVHIAKALSKPTYTIFSPYVNKDFWASFEDGKFHQSIHLLEKQPNLYAEFSHEERKEIEKNPHELYKKLTPKMIIPELRVFLKNNL